MSKDKKQSNGGYPGQIILIRHGEKDDGNKLDHAGEKRAKQLVDFFLYDSRVLAYGVPFAIYAMKPHTHVGSLRPIETVTPTAEKLNITIDKDFQKNDVKDLIKDIFSHSDYDNKTVVVCWEHDAILDILKQLDVDYEHTIKKWPDDVYNWALLVTIDKKGKATDFKCINQKLPMD